MRPFATAFGVFLTFAASARAQNADAKATDLALARELFSDATLLEARADWLAATAKLKRALVIKETPGLYYHLAHCEEQLGALVAAAADYARASELIRDGAKAPDVEPLLPLAERRIESRVAKLELVVPPGISATAELDGRLLPPSALGASVSVDPGAHRVVLRSPGRKDVTSSLELGVGEHRTLKVFYTPDPEAPPPPEVSPTRENTRPSARRTVAHADAPSWFGAREALLLGEGAVTLAGVAVGVVYTFARRDATERVGSAELAVDAEAPSNLNACGGRMPVASCGELSQAIDAHKRAVTLQAVGFAGAAVGGLALGLTWALWPSARTKLGFELRPHQGSLLLDAGGTF
jgi:hypothetical protein